MNLFLFPGAPGHLPLHMQAQQPPPQQVILSFFWYRSSNTNDLKLNKAIINIMTNNIFIMQPPPQQQQQLNQWGTIYCFLQLYCNTFWQFRLRKRMICLKFILIIFIGQLCTPSPFYLISREKARIWRRPRIASWPLSKPPATPIITANANSLELNRTGECQLY